MYKRIITYNFVSDDTRASFVEFLTGLDFEEQPDQSTYAQRRRNPQHLDDLKAAITRWSRDVELSADDHVEIYYLARVDRNNMLINRHDMHYNAGNRDIR
jgi:hypothetical protein